MNKKIFITGIGTDVGKTIGSAIICESLQADYWKPIQAGDIGYGDNEKVQSLVSNPNTRFHPNSYALKTPASPHYAAQLDGVEIDLNQIQEPITDNTLVIEGAGGLLVPLNQSNTVLDLIKPNYHVIVVSRHYLGSINHTLMTLEMLNQKGLSYSIIFNGDENKATESIIMKMSSSHVIGRINEEQTIDSDTIKKYAKQFYQQLRSL
jgi:dethiobiotin synthetase